MQSSNNFQPSSSHLLFELEDEKLVNVGVRGEHIPFVVPDYLSDEDAKVFARSLGTYRVQLRQTVKEHKTHLRTWEEHLGVKNLADFKPEDVQIKDEVLDADNLQLMRVPMGYFLHPSSNEPIDEFILEKREQSRGGTGPHGIIIGETGSGKSELLRTLLLGQCMRHTVEQYNAIWYDWKGGAGIVGLENLPHLTAIVTDLEHIATPDMMDRIIEAQLGELARREEWIVVKGGCVDLYDYNAKRLEEIQTKGYTDLIPIPWLDIFIDEFIDLFKNFPELDGTLFSPIGQKGRAMGMSYVLGAQIYEENLIKKTKDHVRYYIALKVKTAAESKQLLGTPDANQIAGEPGVGFIRHSIRNPDGEYATRVDKFKTFYTAERYNPEHNTLTVAFDDDNPQEVFSSSLISDFNAFEPIQREDLSLLEVEKIPASVSAKFPRKYEYVVENLQKTDQKPYPIWLEPLIKPRTLDEILDSFPVEYPVIPFGIVDDPFFAKQFALTYDPNSGPAIIVGSPRSGKSTALTDLILAGARLYSPEELNFMGIDYGGNNLISLSNLAHVNGFAHGSSKDFVSRVVNDAGYLLRQRQLEYTAHQLANYDDYRKKCEEGVIEDKFGRVFFIIDGFKKLKDDTMLLSPDNPLSANYILSQFGSASQYGIHLILTVTDWSEISGSYQSMFPNQYEMATSNRNAQTLLPSGLRNKIPDKIKGRCIPLKYKKHAMFALPRFDGIDSTEDLSQAISESVDICNEVWEDDRPAPKIRPLPTLVDYSSVISPDKWSDFKVPIGISDINLETAVIDFNSSGHVVAGGSKECGKTEFLRNLVYTLIHKYSSDEVQFFCADPKAEFIELIPEDYLLTGKYTTTAMEIIPTAQKLAEFLETRIPDSTISREQRINKSWWSGPHIFLIADNYTTLVQSGAGMQNLNKFIQYGRDIGFHACITVPIANLNTMVLGSNNIVKEISTASGAFLLMNGIKQDGPIFGFTIGPLPSGRARVVEGSHTFISQLVLQEPGSQTPAVSAGKTRKINTIIQQ